MVSLKLQVMVSLIRIHNLALLNKVMGMGTMNQNMIAKHQPSRCMASNSSLSVLNQDSIPNKEALHLRVAMANSLLTTNLLLMLELLNLMVPQGRLLSQETKCTKGQCHLHMDQVSPPSSHIHMVPVPHRLSQGQLMAKIMGLQQELLMDTTKHHHLGILNQTAKLPLAMGSQVQLTLSQVDSLVVMGNTHRRNLVMVNNQRLT